MDLNSLLAIHLNHHNALDCSKQAKDWLKLTLWDMK
jgi:hypothetical protein